MGGSRQESTGPSAPVELVLVSVVAPVLKK